MRRPGAYLLGGDARALPLADRLIQCVVTSPPYWGLRDYGLEPSVWGGEAEHAHAWEENDTKIGGGGYGPASTLAGYSNENTKGRQLYGGISITQGFCLCSAWRGVLGLEPTPELYIAHLVEVFREVRRVLRDDGTCWLNLGDSYANDMKWGGATSGKHVTALHGGTGIGRQKVFSGLKPKDLVGIPWRVAFALQADGWWLRADIIWVKPNPMPESITDRPTKAHEYVFLLTKSARYYYDAEAIKEKTEPWNPAECFSQGNGNGDVKKAASGIRTHGWASRHDDVAKIGRNRRSVWTIATEPYPESHFATFPEKLVEPCILAGSRPGDRVLDPFAGSGTTVAVAERLGRVGIGVELKPAYLALARRRTVQAGLL